MTAKLLLIKSENGLETRQDYDGLSDVDTTGAATGNSLAIGADNVWRPADLMPRATIIAAGQFSGFVDRNNVVQKYDEATRVVTNEHASGFVETSWNGIITRHASPWVLPAHPATPNRTYFYYSTDGTNYAWSETPWEFEYIQVASIEHGTYLKLPIRECHGLADPEWHRDAHKHIWTYVQSGCGLTAGTYAIGGTASDANNTPGVDAGVLRDEDLPTAVAALAQGSYRVCRPLSGEFAIDSLSVPFPFSVGTYIQYFPTDTAALGATGKFYNVYLVGAPLMLTETGAPHPNRFLWIAPQAQYNSITAAQAESFESLRLGNLAVGTSEYCPIRRLIFGASAAYGTTGKVRLAAVDELERSPLRSAASAASVLSGSGIAGQPAVWASPSSLASQDAVTFRTTIGAGTSSLALGSDSTTAHRGDHGTTAYNHSQATGNPHGTTATQVGAAEADHEHSTDDVTSGILPTSRGGTGNNDIPSGFLISTNQYVQSMGLTDNTVPFYGGTTQGFWNLQFSPEFSISSGSDPVLSFAGIAWGKVSKTGAVAADVGAAPLAGAELLIHSDFGRSATTDVWQSAFTDNTASGLQLAANTTATGTEITIEQVVNIPADGGAAAYQVYIGPQLTGEDSPTGSTYADVIDPNNPTEYGAGTLRIKIELIGSGSSITGYVTSVFECSGSNAPFVRTGAITVDGTIANSIDIRFNPDSQTGYIIRRNRVFRRNP